LCKKRLSQRAIEDALRNGASTRNPQEVLFRKRLQESDGKALVDALIGAEVESIVKAAKRAKLELSAEQNARVARLKSRKGKAKQPEPTKPIDKLRASFLLAHKGFIEGQFPAQGTTITPTSLSPVVSQRFMRAMSSTGKGTTPPNCVFHGTRLENHASIFEHGLLVPNQADNPVSVGVANGSAYGVGIYTATTAATSCGYARNGARVLVCGALEIGESFKVANGFRIFFNKAHVVPLFVVGYTAGVIVSPHQPVSSAKAKARYKDAAQTYSVPGRVRLAHGHGKRQLKDHQRAVHLHRKGTSKRRTKARKQDRAYKAMCIGA
jgi:hypothetical protein